MPVESSDLPALLVPSFTNAFSEADLGLGATKETSWHGIRIDHVLLGPGWACERAWVGPSIGGDHRPLIADVRWRGGA